MREELVLITHCKQNMKPIARRLIISLAVAVGFIVCSQAVSAETPVKDAEYQRRMESLVPHAGRDLSTTHYTWGVELGSSIDLGGNDMSSFDVSLVTGYKNESIQLLGVGAGIRRSFGSHNTFVPIFGVIRTSFRSKPSLLFLHFQAGYSFNSIKNAHVRGDICGSLGLGINLNMSKKFMSHIILAYGFNHFDYKHRAEAGLHADNIPLAQLSFGITL